MDNFVPKPANQTDASLDVSTDDPAGTSTDTSTDTSTESVPATLLCKRCRKPFVPTRQSRTPRSVSLTAQKYCSPRCTRSAYSQRQRQRLKTTGAISAASSGVRANEVPLLEPLPRRHDRGNILTSDVEYSDEEREWLQAVDAYRRKHKKTFPTCSELLALAKSLGYRKVAEPGQLPGQSPDQLPEVKG